MGDKYNCEYNVSDVKLDERFVYCHRDAAVTLLSYLAMIVVVWIVGYTLSPDDPAQMTYLLGFPAWYTVCTLICIGFGAFGCIWALKFRHFSLAAKATAEEVDD